MARDAAGTWLRDGARHALPAGGRARALRRRARAGRQRGRVPPLRGLSSRLGAFTVVDAAAADDAERLQRMARVRARRLGGRERVRARVFELRTVRRAARARGGAVEAAAARASRSAAAEGTLPARQPAPLQPEVLPELAAPLRRLRAAARPSTGRDRGARGRGVPALQRPRAGVTPEVAAGLLLALASAAAL